MGRNHVHNNTDLHKANNNHDHYGSNLSVDKSYLLKALFVTVSFMVIEIIVAVMTNSLTVLSDAGHMFTDALALGLSWYSIRLSSKKSNNIFSYGYYRAQIIAALFNGISLFILSIYILIEAIIRIQNPVKLDGFTLIWVGGAGLIVNLLGLYFVTKASQDNINIKSALYHVLSDMLGSLAALIAGCIIIYSGWMLIDPILSIFISIIFIRITWKLLTESLSILMETAPYDINYLKLENDIKNVSPKIINIHHIHIWSITKNKRFITLHIKVKDLSENNLIISSLEKILHDNFSIGHSTIQIENKDCSNSAC